MANCSAGDRFDPWVGKMPGRRKWQPTPVSLRGESHGHRRLAGYSPRGRKESDTTERPTLSLSHWSMSTGVPPLNLTLACWRAAGLTVLGHPLLCPWHSTPAVGQQQYCPISPRPRASGNVFHLRFNSAQVSSHEWAASEPSGWPCSLCSTVTRTFPLPLLTLVKSCLMRVREQSEKAVLKLTLKN